jgi:N-acetylneuraminic acid mutarotase
VSGSNIINQGGVYGTQGVASASNIPGARTSSASWTDSNGTVWLFGGTGYDSFGNGGGLNDLWKFDGSQWTWVSGYNGVNWGGGVYGTLGVADPANVPGQRINPVIWGDNHGSLWLFGGYGDDSNGITGNLNDLWKFDGSQWAWVSGSNIVNQPGVYGTLGVAAASNIPGGRFLSVNWTDSSGTLWLLGGGGYDSAGTNGDLNDLWKFDGSQWTWVSGSKLVNQNGVYGTLGMAAASNMPGARYGSVGWRDNSGTLWLFGGIGHDSAGTTPPVGTAPDLNDLWKFDGSQWTWVSGSNLVNQSGVPGTLGAAAAGNYPGARDSAVTWVDNSGKFWIFGGIGYDSTGSFNYLNDLWSYQP